MTRRLVLIISAILALNGAVFGQIGAVRIGGAVPRPLILSQDEIASMPHQAVTASAHDQSGRYDGVPLIELLKRAGTPSGEAIRGPELAKSVVVSGADGYRVVFALAELDPAFTGRLVLLADRWNGNPLPDNALPYQVIVPGEMRPARWVRQVVSIEVRQAPPSP